MECLATPPRLCASQDALAAKLLPAARNVDIDLPAGYDEIIVDLIGVQTSVPGAGIGVQVSIDGSAFATSGYIVSGVFSQVGAAGPGFTSVTGARSIFTGINHPAGGSSHTTIRIRDMGNISAKKIISIETDQVDISGNPAYARFSGTLDSPAELQKLRVLFTSGMNPSFSGGSYRVTGIKKLPQVDAAPFFYLNGYGASGSYNIFRFGSDGRANPKAPVIGALAANAGAGVTHIAQPSAIQLPDRLRVFATRHNGSLWFDIAYWDSLDGGLTFGAPTTALSASAIGATYGLVQTTIYYAPGELRPFKMAFGIRQSSSIPAAVTLADSLDCSSWMIQGPAYTPSSANIWEAAGVIPSYVFQASDGEWVLCLSPYDASFDAYSAIAVSSSPNGPFGAATLIASPLSAQKGTLSGTLGSNLATTTIGNLRLGEPYLVWNGSSPTAEIVTPIARTGMAVTFDLPLQCNYSGAAFAHVAARTCEASVIWENADGSWGGYFTCYKALNSVLCEYVIEMSAPSRTGPWSFTQKPIVFSPYGPGNEHLNSTENPSPVVDATA